MIYLMSTLIHFHFTTFLLIQKLAIFLAMILDEKTKAAFLKPYQIYAVHG